MITQDELKRIMLYDPVDGRFTWRINIGNVKAGKIISCKDAYGYIVVRIHHQLYKCHRLAFLYMTGTLPEQDVDHIDRNPANNAWANLRLATRSNNLANRKFRSKSGYKGVTKHQSGYMAQIRVNGQNHYLGLKSTALEASLLYNSAAEHYFGKFACTGSNHE